MTKGLDLVVIGNGAVVRLSCSWEEGLWHAS
jgi:hypothetical protein